MKSTAGLNEAVAGMQPALRWSKTRFKGYYFDAVTQQPAMVLEWQHYGRNTRYKVYARGIIGPIADFVILGNGRRIEYNQAPQTWISWLYPKYPRVA